MTNTKPIPAKKPNYVDNVKFYEALVAYRVKVDAAKAAHEELVAQWKKDCRPILKKIRSENKPLYQQFIEDKIIREEKNSWWPRDISVHYSLPLEPKYISPRVPEYIGKCIYLIAMGLSSYWKFCSYSYRDEMAADGIEDAILRIQSFDPAKSKNPFAYFTQICYFAAVRRIKKEKKQKHVKSEMVKNSGIIDSLSNNVQGGDDAEYQNQYLSFLLENVDNNTLTDEEKAEAQKMKKTTKAHQKKMKDKEALAIKLNVDGIDAIEEVIEDIEDGVEDNHARNVVIDFELEDE